LTRKTEATKSPPLAAAGHHTADRKLSGTVFEIVDLERETQAAVSWRWSFEAISTLTSAVFLKRQP
jgi:hypothetical protein